jgi:hypothetical protein
MVVWIGDTQVSAAIDSHAHSVAQRSTQRGLEVAREYPIGTSRGSDMV